MKRTRVSPFSRLFSPSPFSSRVHAPPPSTSLELHPFLNSNFPSSVSVIPLPTLGPSFNLPFLTFWAFLCSSSAQASHALFFSVQFRYLSAHT